METFSISAGLVLNCLVVMLGVLVLILAFGASKQAEQIAELKWRLRRLEPHSKAPAGADTASDEVPKTSRQDRAFKVEAA